MKNIDLAAVRAMGTAYDYYGITPEDVGVYGKKQVRALVCVCVFVCECVCVCVSCAFPGP